MNKQICGLCDNWTEFAPQKVVYYGRELKFCPDAQKITNELCPCLISKFKPIKNEQTQ